MFSTPERARVLEYVLSNPEQAPRVRRVAKLLGLSPAPVSKYLAILREKGILGKEVIIESPLTRALKILMNVEKVAGVIGRLKSVPKWVRGIGVYGSWANGRNTQESDLDLWFLADVPPPEIDIARMQSDIRKSLGVECNALVLTKKKLELMLERDPVMYYSLVNSFVIRGAGID